MTNLGEYNFTQNTSSNSYQENEKWMLIFYFPFIPKMIVDTRTI